MRDRIIPVNYYQNFDADYLLDIPAEGYGGWKKTELRFDLDELAIVVMHAWDYASYDKYPCWYNVAEWIPRAKKICQEHFPGILSAARNSNIKLFHVASDESYCRELPGYKRTLEVAIPALESHIQRAEISPSQEELRDFKMKNSYYGLHNKKGVENVFKNMTFAAEAKPLDNEDIAVYSDQLYSLCRIYGINHLIYIGFNINWCLQNSPCGMVDMSRRGLMCSAIRQAVTAVENKETARHELCKEIALWRIALEYGFIFDVDDFVTAFKD